MPTRTNRPEPSNEDRANAAAFAKWQKNARDLKGWNIPRLCDAIGYSDSLVRIFDEEGDAGIDNLDRYRQPKQAYIEAIAKMTGADLEAGMVAAGRWKKKDPEKPEPPRIAPGIEIVVDLRDGPRRGTLSEQTLRAIAELLQPLSEGKTEG